MSAKEILQILKILVVRVEDSGLHRKDAHKLTPESLQKPTVEDVVFMFTVISKWSYRQEPTKLKAQLNHDEFVIHEEAMDIDFVFELTKKICLIAGIEDLSFKDFWEPHPKRLATILSGVLNFLKFFEKRATFYEAEEHQRKELETQYMAQIQQKDMVDQEIKIKAKQWLDNQPAQCQAERAYVEASELLSRKQDERKTADFEVEEKERTLKKKEEEGADIEDQLAQQRQYLANLQEQIAESPDLIQQEIKELNLSQRQKKVDTEEKCAELISRKQREEVLERLENDLANYQEELDKFKENEKSLNGIKEQTRKMRKDSDNVQKAQDHCVAEERQLQEQVRQAEADTERNAQAHMEIFAELEEKRHRAFRTKEAMEERRAVEEREIYAQQILATELEADIQTLHRDHQVTMAALADEQSLCLELGTAMSRHYQSLPGTHEAMLNQLLDTSLDMTPSEVMQKLQQMRQTRQVMLTSPSPARATTALKSPRGLPQVPCLPSSRARSPTGGYRTQW